MARTLAFPVRLNTDGSYVTVEQGSDQEIVGCAHMALLCPQGHRELDEEYGIPGLEFTPVGLDHGAVLRESVLRDEPRLADVQASEEIDTLINAAVVTLQGVRA